MAKQSPAQKETVERVMHEYKHGELRIRGNGPKVKSARQAIAIALHEAGATNQESLKTNREALKTTKAKERKGETAQAAVEGNKAGGASAKGPKSAKGRKPAAKNRAASDRTKAELYNMAKKREIPGRSKMNKDELARALHA
jgi:hypothetical protein